MPQAEDWIHPYQTHILFIISLWYIMISQLLENWFFWFFLNSIYGLHVTLAKLLKWLPKLLKQHLSVDVPITKDIPVYLCGLHMMSHDIPRSVCKRIDKVSLPTIYSHSTYHKGMMKTIINVCKGETLDIMAKLWGKYQYILGLFCMNFMPNTLKNEFLKLKQQLLRPLHESSKEISSN